MIMKPADFDHWLLIFVVALLIAMTVTLLFGKGWSRHGYGFLLPQPDQNPSYRTNGYPFAAQA